MARHPKALLVANGVYAALLVVLGLLPYLPQFGKEIPDYVPHGAAYALQAALLFSLAEARFGAAVGAVAAAVGATAFGGLVELLQLFQPARTFEAGDLLANALGAGAASAAAYLWTRWGGKGKGP